MHGKWKVIDSKELLKIGFFRLRQDRLQLPDGREMPHYYVMEISDWVHVVALTENGQLIMVKQYRPAGEDYFLEVPGGTTDTKNYEDPEHAALRELKEETGYEAGSIKYLGACYPNPALQTNRLHTFLARDCKKTAEPDLDPYEDIEVVLMSRDEVKQEMKNNKLKHALALVSLYKANL